MSERQRLMFVASVSGTAVTLSRHQSDVGTDGGIGVDAVVVTTRESTADAGFWGTTGSCALFHVIFRKVQ